ncbi:MAG: hypothetical protein FWE03_01215 [Firmicutes bacterium]|nr:hypothetical protein [Bacillota bacterium]
MEKRNTNTGLYVLTGLVALAALATMFFRFIVVRGVTFRRTGFHIFQSGNALNIVLMILLILATVSVIVLSFGRAGGAFGTEKAGKALMILGVSMAVLSFVLFMTATRINWIGFSHVYRRGGGLIGNLILSIITAALSFVPLLTDRSEEHRNKHKRTHA